MYYTDSKEFYPTPPKIIDVFMNSLDLSGINTILEPSAGKGDLVDAILNKKKELDKSYRNKDNYDVDVIEIDSHLRVILKDKGCRIVHNDFLTYDTRKSYDLIIMNPPFSNGDAHLLKALEMQSKYGGQIRCILNAETIRNTHTKLRTSLKRELEYLNADITFIKDGFIDAERKTSVEIAFIAINIPKQRSSSFILDQLKKTKKHNEMKHESTQVLPNNFEDAIIAQYNFEMDAGINLIREYKAMKPYILNSLDKNHETGEIIQKGNCLLELQLTGESSHYHKELSINKYVKSVRNKYWRALFENKEFTRQLTDNLRDELINRIEELSEYDFSLYNIREVKIEMIKRLSSGLEDTIIDLFDEFSHHHSWYDETSKNILHYNGWKTNKAHIVNKKVIIPLNAYEFFGKFRSSYQVLAKLANIEKCFAFLDGKKSDGQELEYILRQAESAGLTKNIQCQYFNITLYKKGTCHITFTDEELLKKFNIFGSQKKGWLPPCYGEKSYENMTIEEKGVIDAFEGEKAYEQVLKNTSRYLFSALRLPLLTG